MAGAVTLAIGLTVALWPDLWLRLSPTIPQHSRRAVSISESSPRPTACSGLAMALNFAAMGAAT